MAKPRDAEPSRRRRIVATASGLLLVAVAVGAAIYGAAPTVDETPKVSATPSVVEVAAVDSARANLLTAIGEAQATLSAADPEAADSVTLSATLDVCVALSVSVDADVNALSGCEFSVRSAAAAIPARP